MIDVVFTELMVRGITSCKRNRIRRCLVAGWLISRKATVQTPGHSKANHGPLHIHFPCDDRKKYSWNYEYEWVKSIEIQLLWFVRTKRVNKTFCQLLNAILNCSLFCCSRYVYTEMCISLYFKVYNCTYFSMKWWTYVLSFNSIIQYWH